jgi:hypothetical protein
LQKQTKVLGKRCYHPDQKELLFRNYLIAKLGLNSLKANGQMIQDYRDKPFIVVITAGRTGSTLLQGILNSFPGYLVRGENHGFIVPLYQAYLSLVSAKTFRPNSTPRHAWYGAAELSERRFAEDIAPVIARQLRGSNTGPYRALGFKEIRWREIGDITIWGLMEFIEIVFPNSKFILLTRNRSDMMQSGWWPTQNNSETHFSIEQLNMLTRSAKVKSLFEIDYSHLLPNHQKLFELCQFLGEDYSQAINDTLALPHCIQTDN